MKAKSIKGKSSADIKAALEKNMADRFTPTVAIVFLEADMAHEEICSILSEKGIQVFGASSGSNFTDGEIESESVVALLLDIKPEYFLIKSSSAEKGSLKESAEEIGRAGMAAFRKPAFLIVSGGITSDGDAIVNGIENVCGNGVTIFGGLAADSLKMIRTYVFTNGSFTDNGLIALILDEDKINLSGKAIAGWRPVGIDHIITHSNGNILYTIDDEPALKFISRYTGVKDFFASDISNLILSSNFQLQLLRDNKHPVMRTPMYANPDDHSIVFAGSLPQGSKIRLAMLPSFEVIEGALQGFAEYKNDQPDADALIMFSCAGRQISLGPFVSDEINGIKEIWNAPMAGFFCFGEIGRVEKGNTEFHNMTCSLALLKEK